MKINGSAHARLQIAIEEWMRENISEASPLFRMGATEDDYDGVSIGESRAMNASGVAMHAATAAYQSVIASLAMLGLDERSNALAQGREPLVGEASLGATGSAAADSEKGD